ncbi:efflux transporter periplasmic adaptor subunit [Stutzerimonas nosocomialis]|uniref:Efflux transporter periplasmic adaptor subunit n=1 Tax=Stutzerimonas nosocomialis TaxID=1056496 RepID=A0A5R9QEA4_9GAMM|nr:efflux RND transporter periplasmic adaptor subunit [Stutzerimonas nosocomialis]TLX63431.1 efflux transporter periplasmic adaptor subunit [Stutzerimonas nosocomialis]
MLRRMLIMLGAVILVVLILAALKFNSISKQIEQFTAPKPPVSVEVVQASELDWQNRLPAIGTLKASQGVDLSVEVAGTVSQLQFRSGQKVEKGQPILTLDSEVEQASLAAAEADLGLARIEFERARSLIDRQSIARSEFDRLNAQLQRANATVAQLRASLARKRIVAPFAGTIGIRQVDVGAYIAAGTPVATLQDLSTLFVDFYLAEQQVPLLGIGQRVRVEVAAYPGEGFDGEIVALNPKVEETTRNVLVRAELENPEGRLLPGMFANLQVVLPEEAPKIAIPETAITFTLYGNSVLLVKEQPGEDGNEPRLVIERRFVETGDRRDGLVVVRKGLAVGERVVTSGQLKLDNGTHVVIADGQTLSPAPATGQDSR